jgi:hypothetical protein
MKNQWLFCSACDRLVRVRVADPTGSRETSLNEAEIVCLEIGIKCTGNLCPLCARQAEALTENGPPQAAGATDRPS